MADQSNEEKARRSKPTIDAQIGVCGDYAHIEGGIHFHQYLSPPTSGRPFQAPPLPAHFVPRPDITEALKARLLTDDPITPGILVVSAIHGLGGIGKSTLAAALAYDSDMQDRFKDGILWATLGQQPDLLSLLSGWVQALGDYDFRPTTVEAATTHLRTLLQEKAILLVVDDVWDPEHVIPFKVGGSQGQVLITTRRADVTDEVGATLHQMDVMTEEQSLDLLAARLGRPLKGEEGEAAKLVAKAVGYLPLALELAAVRVSRGSSWTDLNQALETEIVRLEALDTSPRRRRKQKRPQLEASFNLSLNALWENDEKAWEAFVWLGVLPDDVRIAAPMTATLWTVDDSEAVDLLELLWNDALLLPASPILIGEREWPAYRLHDLLHDIARRLLTMDAPQGLGFTLPAAHTSLLDCYKQRTKNNRWHTLPDDGYIHAHLSVHLVAAGRVDELEKLVEQREWYEVQQVHDPRRQTFVTDVRRVVEVAEAQGINGLPRAAAYSLLYATLVTQTTDIPPEALEVMARLGDFQHALKRAELIGNAQISARAFCRLALVAYQEDRIVEAKKILKRCFRVVEVLWFPTLIEFAETLYQIEGSENALAILEQGYSRAVDLSDELHDKAVYTGSIAVAMWQLGYKERAEQVVHDILEIIGQFSQHSAYRKLEALVELGRARLKMGYVAEAKDLLREAEIVAKEIYGNSRWGAQSNILTLMAEIGEVDRALKMARNIYHPDEEYHQILSSIIVAMARHSQIEQALQILPKIEDAYHQARTLCEIAKQAPHAVEKKHIADILTTPQDNIIRWDWDVKPPILAFALQCAWLIEKPKLAKRILHELLAECEKLTFRQSVDWSINSETLARIGRQLAKCKEFDSAFDILELIKHSDKAVDVLTALAETVGLDKNTTKAPAVFDQILSFVDRIVPWRQAEVLAYVAWAKFNFGEQAVPQTLMNQASSLVLNIGDKLRIVHLVAAAWAQIGHLDKAIEVFQTHGNWAPNVPSETELMPIVKKMAQAPTLTEAALVIGNVGPHYFYDKVVLEIIETLKEGNLTDAYIRAESLASSGMFGGDPKRKAWSGIFEELSQRWSKSTFAKVAFMTLQVARSQGRNEVNLRIAALAPSLRKLGGCGSIVELYERMQRVDRLLFNQRE